MAGRYADRELRKPPGSLIELLGAWGVLFVVAMFFADAIAVIALLTDYPQISGILGFTFAAASITVPAMLSIQEPRSWLIDVLCGALTLILSLMALTLYGPGLTTFLWSSKGGPSFLAQFPTSILLYTAIPLGTLRLLVGLTCYALSTHPKTATTFRTTLAIRRQKSMRPSTKRRPLSARRQPRRDHA